MRNRSARGDSRGALLQGGLAEGVLVHFAPFSLALTVFLLVAPASFAQTPAGPSTPPPAPPAGGTTITTTTTETTKETSKAADPDLSPALYTYEVGGRRDPFRSLLIRNPNQDRGPRPSGPAGMMVDELELQGTIRIKSGWVAMMKGSDNRAYLLKKGNTVFDGEVIDITGGDITFRQNVNDPTNPKPFRDVVKSLALQKPTP